jgi:predicted nuclease with RNAse H fold
LNYPVFFGIDLTSSENKPSACFGLDTNSEVIYLGFLRRNQDIIRWLRFYLPLIVAIDAPLTLPSGLCCLEESCSCRPNSPWKNRQCDRELRQLGIPCYPTTKKTFIKNLIYRGIELRNAIKHKIEQVGQVIEIYPYASKVRLFGKNAPRKSTTEGLNFYRAKLQEILPSLKPYCHILDHNLCDAAVAAYTALLHSRNHTILLGKSEEGLIIIPR